MARAPLPAAAEVAVEEPVESAAPVAEAPVDEGAEPVVVATILKAADGSFILETGDEPEAPMADADPMAMPEGKTFTADEDGIGKLMTAVLDIVDPENAEGPAAQASFAEGFGGDEAKAPPA